VNLNNVIIHPAFERRYPSSAKMSACRKFFEEHGYIDREIVISPDNILIDGYVGYLVLLENGITQHAVKVSKEIPDWLKMRKSKEKTDENNKYRHEETVYVYGTHSGNTKEYVWRIAENTKNAGKIAVGSSVIVRTRKGECMVTVTKIVKLPEPPTKGVVKKVLRCLTD